MISYFKVNNKSATIDSRQWLNPLEFARFDLPFHLKIGKVSKSEKFINFSFKWSHSSFFRPHACTVAQLASTISRKQSVRLFVTREKIGQRSECLIRPWPRFKKYVLHFSPEKALLHIYLVCMHNIFYLYTKIRSRKIRSRKKSQFF